MNLLPAELIKKKRRGLEHSAQELHFLIDGYTKGSIPDYQMAAWLMTVYFQGLSRAETASLTHEMMHSGQVLDLSSLPGRKIDKHSTGGVGDKASLILGPVAAAAGVRVPMIAGRGLGHTGGTLDKLESIPGFSINLTLPEFRQQISDLGISIMGQTAEICPADRKIYALRDVTATVESLPLICASIMSKKLAEGIDGLVMDVKFGDGAFMKSQEDALNLATRLREIGADHGKKVVALITSMDQPLGRFVGNALEVQECVDILSNKQHLAEGIDLYAEARELSLELAGYMIWLAGISESPAAGLVRAQQELTSGRALNVFHELIRQQGGQLDKLPTPTAQRQIRAQQSGYICGFSTEQIGVAAIHLRAGRSLATDKIVNEAGIEVHKKIGQEVRPGDLLFSLYGNTESDFVTAESLLQSSVKISLQKCPAPDLIQQRLID